MYNYTFATSWHCTEGFSVVRQEKKKKEKASRLGRKNKKLSLFIDEMIIYIENTVEFMISTRGNK